jgi:hypothetical protein
MPPKAPTHAAYNTLPSAFKGSHGIEPVDILNLFLTKSLLETMSANTNAYAAEKVRKVIRRVDAHGKRLPLQN